MNKIPIAPTLKKLELYESAEFALTQYTSVNSGIQVISTGTTLRFTQKKCKDNNTVKVTRIA